MHLYLLLVYLIYSLTMALPSYQDAAFLFVSLFAQARADRREILSLKLARLDHSISAWLSSTSDD